MSMSDVFCDCDPGGTGRCLDHALRAKPTTIVRCVYCGLALPLGLPHIGCSGGRWPR